MEKKNRRKLEEGHALQIIEDWERKSVDDFADEFEVAPSTVRSMVYQLRKEDPSLCPKKRKKSRKDIAQAAIKMFREQASTEVSS